MQGNTKSKKQHLEPKTSRYADALLPTSLH